MLAIAKVATRRARGRKVRATRATSKQGCPSRRAGSARRRRQPSSLYVIRIVSDVVDKERDDRKGVARLTQVPSSFRLDRKCGHAIGDVVGVFLPIEAICLIGHGFGDLGGTIIWCRSRSGRGKRGLGCGRRLGRGRGARGCSGERGQSLVNVEVRQSLGNKGLELMQTTLYTGEVS